MGHEIDQTDQYFLYFWIDRITDNKTDIFTGCLDRADSIVYKNRPRKSLPKQCLGIAQTDLLF